VTVTRFCADLSVHDKALVEDYLRLSDDVNAILAELSRLDPHLAELVERFPASGFVRQDPAETLLSFICPRQQHPRINSRHRGAFHWLWRFGLRAFAVLLLCIPQGEVLAGPIRRLLQTRSLWIPRANLKKRRSSDFRRGEGWLGSLRGVSYAQAREKLGSR